MKNQLPKNNKRILISLGLLALLLVTLAACGGDEVEEADEIAVTRVVTESEEVAADEAAAEPTGPGTEASSSEAGSAGSAPTGPGAGVKGDADTGEGWIDEEVGEAPVREAVAELAAPEPIGTAVTDDGGVTDSTVSAPTALTAGEVDDNAQWDDYLLYLRNYQGPAAIPVDVSIRHQIYVQDGQGLPLLSALLRIEANGQEVMRLRTHSDGRAYFFPLALPAPAVDIDYEVLAEVDGAVVSLTIPAGTDQREWFITHSAGASLDEAVNLDILFLIDATGSMGDEIAQLKENIQYIAAQVESLPGQPDARYAMVIYRDRGDAFVARTFEFTPDIDTFAAALNEVEALGGDDYPEDLNTALNKAVRVPEWRVENTVSLIFLVADAPPHLDYADQETDYADEMMVAATRGIKIYPIASSGLDQQGEYVFRQLAQVTGGRFIFLTYGAGGPGTTGSETDLSVSDYSVAALDDLVLQIIAEELAHRQP